jgi:catechol 2,3-dioxygenase-like lactoylglutathione lyase family enzyme
MYAAALLLPGAASAQTPPPPSTPQASAVETVLVAPGLSAADLGRSTKFYATALGLAPCTTLHHGPVTEVILCSDAKAPRPVLILVHDDTAGGVKPGDAGGLDKVVMRAPDLTGVAARMKAAGYPEGEFHAASQGPAVLMIKDPDGHRLELVQGAPSHG